MRERDLTVGRPRPRRVAGQDVVARRGEPLAAPRKLGDRPREVARGERVDPGPEGVRRRGDDAEGRGEGRAGLAADARRRRRRRRRRQVGELDPEGTEDQVGAAAARRPARHGGLRPQAGDEQAEGADRRARSGDEEPSVLTEADVAAGPERDLEPPLAARSQGAQGARAGKERAGGHGSWSRASARASSAARKGAMGWCATPAPI
jgi:hypothetical protein